MTCLAGRTILVVEDEPLIALDISEELQAPGAAVTTTDTLKHALILVEHDGLGGAILDHTLSDRDCSQLCARLKERRVPFLIYSGHDTFCGACEDAVRVSKPAGNGELSSALVALITGGTTEHA